MAIRSSGILLHITSLPSRYGIGDLGPGAFAFADFLHKAGQSYWQILPLNPTNVFLGSSPYNSCSVFAGNELLISPDILKKENMLSKPDLAKAPRFNDKQVNYSSVTRYKNKILDKAFNRFQKKQSRAPGFKNFCRENAFWLDDYALYMALKGHFKKAPWDSWPKDIRDRKKEEIAIYQCTLEEDIRKQKFFQYVFFRQWKALRQYCQKKRIKIIGDLPIYVNYDSADVWANPQLFKLDKNRAPRFVSGVPPDYFSKTGQLWGNPIYRWDVMKKNKYQWWIRRLKQNFNYFDIVRIDHFRGFVAYWQVSRKYKTAMKGQWIKAPVHDFLNTIFKRFSRSSMIAEDLGVITPDVKAVMKKYQLRGMKVLMFAFDNDSSLNSYLPHNYSSNCVAYTGTHDNNTVKGWFEKEASLKMQSRLFKYIGKRVSAAEVSWAMIRLVMESDAGLAILPMQDVLNLGQGARMNQPSTDKNNWMWRVLKQDLSMRTANRLQHITKSCGRS